jgi:hypothetical protein
VTRPTPKQWNRQYAVTIALLIGFAVLVAVMIWLAGGDDRVWQRRVYLFGAVEAIVFTAIGWLFGREVHRSSAETARRDAETAKHEAEVARTEAKEGAVQAAAAEQKVNAVRAAARAAQPSSRGGPQDVSGNRGAAPIDLARFLDEFLKDDTAGGPGGDQTAV